MATNSRTPSSASTEPFQKYEIAAPLTYTAFHLDSTTKPAPEKQITSESEKVHEPWSDAGSKEVPIAKALDRTSFTEGDAETRVDAAVTREKRAVWIVHGMGQQIPFETVDTLTQGLLDVLKSRVVNKPRLRTVKIGDAVMQRVELDIEGTAQGGQKQHYDLHLYESYWAPKTEGVAKLTDVVGFLWDGGTRGLLNYFKKFQRAMFGGMAEFHVSYRTPLWLCLALLILASLTVINGVVLLAGVAQSGIFLRPLQDHWDKLTALTSCMLAVALSFGALLFISDMSKPQSLSSFWRVLIGFCCWTAMIITIFEILKTAALMALITHTDWLRSSGTAMAAPSSGWLACFRTWAENIFESIPARQLQGFATVAIFVAAFFLVLAMITGAALRSSGTPLHGHGFLVFLSIVTFLTNLAAIAGCIWIWCVGSTWGLPRRLAFLESPLWVWPFLIAFTAKVRELMVQYVGDVAIYVTSNKLDRFDEVRNKIKESARTVASAIFTVYKPNTTTFLYDKVAVVGHSLGSVIAYDTLNRLMLDDWLAGQALGIAKRTEAMVTFGSPLNKTAFLFTIQGKNSMHIRERLACTVQPLILNYRNFRKLHWINVYSRNDIISGPLTFYDLPGYQNPPVPPQAIRNEIDKDAAVPLIAHVAYWKNKKVWEELSSHIVP